MATTVNTRLAAGAVTTNSSDSQQGGTGSGSEGGVDLDNLFSFLSEMTVEKDPLTMLADQMNDLVNDVDKQVIFYIFYHYFVNIFLFFEVFYYKLKFLKII